MVNELYFFDSYALIELIEGNPNYDRFKENEVITSKVNLYEVYYNLLRDNKSVLGEIFLQKEFDCALELEKEDIIMAAKFKLLHNKQNISMVDALGYVIAKRLNIKFLTGDKEFKGMENVEFVK